jgi:conjugative relaxase-like TrwC/TraI family protein
VLLIWEVTSGAEAKSYYAGSVAVSAKAARQEYYSEGQEAAGRYGGKLAAELGIAGKAVDQESFERLCDNKHPTKAGAKLTPRTNDHRRVCYDLTWSGPKSFSIVEAFAREGERELLRQAFDEAVEETIAHDIEPDMQARERRSGADHDITTGNVLTASFDHLTARPVEGQPPDPHFHKHTLFWNATRSPDGRLLAGQFGNIVRDKAFYEAAFYARLAKKLEAIGYVIDRRGGKEWEIAGVPQSLIDKFDKRTDQIEAEADKRGITDASRKARLGAEIRSKKQKERRMAELRNAWGDQISDAEWAALAAVYRKQIARGADVTASHAIGFAIAHLSEQQSVWPERDLRRVALLHGLGCVSPEEIAAELPRQGVIVREIDGRRLATTVALQAEEDFLVSVAGKGRGTVLPIGVPEGLSRVRADGKLLNDGQWEIVTDLLDSPNRVNLVQGPAGAGKSWSLKKYDEAMRMKGERVTYLATTTDAVEVLQEGGFDKAHGFDVKTVAHFLLDEKMQRAAQGGRVVIDETSMLGHRDAVKLFQIARDRDLKLIFVGDPMQHGSVGRGALMRLLADYAGIKPFRLTEIMRQEETDYLAAAKLLSVGKAAEGFAALDAKGWVHEIIDDAKREAAIAAEYVHALKDKASVILVSPTHAEAARVTQAIREQLRAAGKLETEEAKFDRLVQVNATEAERKLATTYRVNDVLQFHQNAKGHKKGERLLVTDPAKVPLSEAAKFSLYRPEEVRLSVGDKIRGTGTAKTLDGKHKLRNGSMHTVAGFTDNGIKLDNGWVLPNDAGHFRLGWVDTSFSSQGKTVQRAILAMSSSSLGATNMEQMYVSSTRATKKLTVFTDDKQAVLAGIQRSSQKATALDLRQHQAAARPTLWERVRHYLSRRRRREVIASTRAAYEVPVQQKAMQAEAGYER